MTTIRLIGSMNMPSTASSSTIITRIIQGGRCDPTSNCAVACGMPSRASTKALNIPETMSRTNIAVVRDVLSNMRLMLVRFRLPSHQAISNELNAPTAPASVGVAMPV